MKLKNKTFLQSQCSCTIVGDVKPADMGTTGLIAYTLVGIGDGKNRWQRILLARKLAIKKYGDASLFLQAIVRDAKRHGINTRRMEIAIAKIS